MVLPDIKKPPPVKGRRLKIRYHPLQHTLLIDSYDFP